MFCLFLLYFFSQIGNFIFKKWNLIWFFLWFSSEDSDFLIESLIVELTFQKILLYFAKILI